MFILGTTLVNWIKLLIQNRFAINIKKIPLILLITVGIILLTPFSLIERLLIHPRVRRKNITYPPIFILGHWRSGTTHLHNLFIRDDRFAYPNLVDAIFPNHNILSSTFLRRLLAITLPEKRPMDDMKLNVDFPGEHDWAISNLSLVSPYTGSYFPNNWDRYQKYAHFENATEGEKQLFADTMRFFLKKLTYKYNGKQLVLKSPMDTARAKLLKEIFPNAKFVHIYRNPYEVFFSTRKLHRENQDIFPLQDDKRDLDTFILESYKKTHDAYFQNRQYIPEEDLVEISYEQLTDDRVGTMEEIYQKLDLPSFDYILDRIEVYVKELGGYTPDEYVIESEEKSKIYQHWSRTIDKWGYDIKTSATTN